ncbi:MAG TPA: UbiA-like polyprenyltransferase [Candidatus Limnocylindrales bacterium]|nr:UbiA-like polyprenyltransferase [Candidatus Limnocylindrales bacterium]
MKSDLLRQSQSGPADPKRPGGLKSKIADFGSLVRFSHTVFALPFALASIALAWPRHPVTVRGLFWILVAMVGARTGAMGFNRLADRKFDALNPRTKNWELPQGKVKVGEAVSLTTLASAIFILAAYEINWICFVLSPLALGIVFFYSLTKRFTWASHLFLGLALAIAPIGAWLAVARPPFEIGELQVPCYLGLAVVFWLAGFDIIYSLQDREFDSKIGLHSIPVSFGVAGALRLSAVFHFATVLFLALVGIAGHMGLFYWLGFLAVAAVLAWEHRIVTPTDMSRINKAFFDLNAYVSLGYFLFTVADVLLRSKNGIGG